MNIQHVICSHYVRTVPGPSQVKYSLMIVEHRQVRDRAASDIGLLSEGAWMVRRGPPPLPTLDPPLGLLPQEHPLYISTEPDKETI